MPIRLQGGRQEFGAEDIVTLTAVDAEVFDGLPLVPARFEASALAGLSEVQLAVRYDDGFVAYLNGVEVTRSSVGSGSGASADGIEAHEAKGWELFPLGTGAELASRLGEGDAVLAIEGHNKTKGSSDFTLDPCLIGPALERAPLLEDAVLLDELTLTPREDR